MTDKKINDGGAAFPASTSYGPNGEWSPPYNTGMSLRDWFAGMALQGIIAGTFTHMGDLDGFVKDAYEYADAMIVRREAQ